MNRLSRLRVQDQFTGLSTLNLFVEVEHLSDRTGDTVETALADALPREPVVLDESQHGGLVDNCMVDEVLIGPRRNYNEWLARAIAAAAQGMRVRGIHAGECGIRVSAHANAREEVCCSRRGVYDRPHLMVVPAIGIVVHDDYRGAALSGLLLQKVEERHQEHLLVQRIGVSGMTVLISGCFDETYSREIARAHGTVKIGQIITMVGRAIVPDFG